MVKFLEIPLFYVKFHIFIENVKKVVAEFAKIQFPAPARPGCARPYKTNAIPSLFRGSWRPGAHFRKNSYFHKIITKIEKSDFLADFSFFDENPDFHENGGIAKTPIIPKEYQWFWRVDCPENAKTTKFTEMYEILWNFQQFHDFM